MKRGTKGESEKRKTCLDNVWHASGWVGCFEFSCGQGVLHPLPCPPPTPPPPLLSAETKWNVTNFLFFCRFSCFCWWKRNVSVNTKTNTGMSGSPLLAIPLPLTLSATLLQLSDYLSPCRRPSVSLSPSTPNGKLNNNKTRQETAPSCPVFCFCLCLFLLANCFSTFNPPTSPQPPFYSSFFFFLARSGRKSNGFWAAAAPITKITWVPALW